MDPAVRVKHRLRIQPLQPPSSAFAGFRFPVGAENVISAPTGNLNPANAELGGWRGWMRRRCFTRTAGSINNLGSSPSGLRRDRAQCNSAVETHVLPGHEGFSADASTLDLEAGRILEVRLCNVTTADDQRIIAMRVETHEAEVWARCFELAAAVPGNPLGAVIDRSGPCPLPALTAVDSGSFNRIVALGVADPGDPDTIDRIVSFYRDLGQLNYRVELAPVAPPDCLLY